MQDQERNAWSLKAGLGALFAGCAVAGGGGDSAAGGGHAVVAAPAGGGGMAEW